MQTQIMAHGCSSPAQDQLHGKGNRVFNALKAGGHRCTVCGQLKK